MILTKRVYEPISPRDGKRFLVERLWPRGMTKSSLRMVSWMKDAAPSQPLRKWYAHDLAKWPQFKQLYLRELARHPEAIEPLIAAARKGTVTLLYSASDVEHNSAGVLKTYLAKQVAKRASGSRPLTRTARARSRTARTRR